MGKLNPFCIASDGDTIYAVSYAYDTSGTLSFVSGLKDYIVLTRTRPQRSETLLISNHTIDTGIVTSPLDQDWQMLGSFPRPDILDGEGFHFTCRCAAKKASSAVPPVSEDLVIFSIEFKPRWKTDDISGQYVLDPDQQPRRLLFTEKDMFWTAAMHPVPEDEWSTDKPGATRALSVDNQRGWVRAYNVHDEMATGGQRNVVRFGTSRSNDGFPTVPEHTWTIAQEKTQAITMDGKNLYAFGTLPKENSLDDQEDSRLGLTILPIQTSADGLLDFSAQPARTIVKALDAAERWESDSVHIPASLLPYTSMAASEGVVFGMAYDLTFGGLSGRIFYSDNTLPTQPNSSTTTTSPTFYSWPVRFPTPTTGIWGDKSQPNGGVLPLTPLFCSSDLKFNLSDPEASYEFLTGFPGGRLFRIKLQSTDSISTMHNYSLSIAQEFYSEFPREGNYNNRDKDEASASPLVYIGGVMGLFAIISAMVFLMRNYCGFCRRAIQREDEEQGQNGRRHGRGIQTYREQASDPQTDMQDGEMLPMYTYKVPDTHTRATPEDLEAIAVASVDTFLEQRAVHGSGSGSVSRQGSTSSPMQGSATVPMTSNTTEDSAVVSSAISEQQLQDLQVQSRPEVSATSSSSLPSAAASHAGQAPVLAAVRADTRPPMLASPAPSYYSARAPGPFMMGEIVPDVPPPAFTDAPPAAAATDASAPAPA